MTWRLARPAAVVVTLSALAVAACGSSNNTTASPSGSAAAGSTPNTSVTGNITWWTDLTLDQINAYIKGFNAVYPNVKVDYLRSDDAEMYDRFNTQCKAGNVQADVVTVGYDGFSKDWDKAGCLSKYASPESSNLPKTALSTDNSYYVYASLLEGICYNTEVLTKNNLPKPTKWEDLANPLYKDKLVQQDILKVGSGSNAWVIDMRTYWNNDTRWEAFFSKMGTQNVVFQPQYTAAQAQLVQGNFAVQPVCYLDYIAADINKGAPVVWVAVDPVITVGFSVQIPTTAKNTPGAKAFVDYTLSAAGQTVISQKVGETPVRTDVPLPKLADSAKGVPQLPALETPKSASEFKDNAQYYVGRLKGWFHLQ
jgi:iron(III) transport system substrate-binding protein